MAVQITGNPSQISKSIVDHLGTTTHQVSTQGKKRDPDRNKNVSVSNGRFRISNKTQKVKRALWIKNRI